MSFSRKAEAKSVNRDRADAQFISSFQVELSFLKLEGVPDRRYSFEKECWTKDSSLWKISQVQCKYEFPIMSQAKQVDKVQVNKIDSVSNT